MKQKRRSADSRDSRKTRASSVAAAVRGAIRRWARLAALRRYHAHQVPVSDPAQFYHIRAFRSMWDPRTRAEIGVLSRRNGHISTSFSRKMSALKRLFRTIRIAQDRESSFKRV